MLLFLGCIGYIFTRGVASSYANSNRLAVGQLWLIVAIEMSGLLGSFGNDCDC